MKKFKTKDKLGLTAPSDRKIDHIAFSFEYFTSNKGYSFGYFGKDIRGSREVYENFFKKLCYLSTIDI